MTASALNIDDSATDGGLRGLLDVLWRLHTRDETAVLGVVAATDGSTYQKPGSLVLLDAHGLRHGVISGGCLEPELEEAARRVYAQRRAALVEFDTSSDDDLLFGSGIGCRGRMQLLLLPLPPRAPLARALFTALDGGVTLELALATTGADAGAGMANVVAPGQASDPPVARWDETGQASATAFTPSLHLRVPAPPRLMLLGAGPETPPLAAFARRLGWFVGVIEHRGRWLEFARRAHVDRLYDRTLETALELVAQEHADAMLAMSHNYAMDLTALKFCAHSDASYVGLLGPPARRAALLAELDAEEASRLSARLHAPVGLDLGGHGPEPIALAIAAELQRHFTALPRRAGSPVAVVEHA